MEYKDHSYKYVKGNAFIPERFWIRIYITQSEYDGLLASEDFYNLPEDSREESYISYEGIRYFKEDFRPIEEVDKRYIDMALAGKL